MGLSRLRRGQLWVRWRNIGGPVRAVPKDEIEDRIDDEQGN